MAAERTLDGYCKGGSTKEVQKPAHRRWPPTIPKLPLELAFPKDLSPLAQTPTARPLKTLRPQSPCVDTNLLPSQQTSVPLR